MVKNVVCSFVEFLRAVLRLRPSKCCAIFFGPPDIYILKVIKLSFPCDTETHSIDRPETWGCFATIHVFIQT